MPQQYDFLSGVQSGQDWVKGLYNQNAQYRAGGQLASGDTAGASQTLYRSGNLQGGRALQEQGASDAAAAQSSQQAASAEQLRFTLDAAKGLKTVRQQGGNVLEAYNALTPALIQMGTSPQQISQLGEQIAANPGILDQIEQISGAELRKLEVLNLGGGSWAAVDPTSGERVNGYNAPRESGGVVYDPETYQPILDTREPKTVTVQNSDGSSSIVQVDQPAPVSRAAPAQASGVDVIDVIQTVIPGVSFNSGLRTAEQNRSAGGADRSYHLRGQAVDIPPQSGKTVEQLRSELRAAGVDVKELLNEGDHWHIAWGNDSRAPNFGRGEAPRSGTRVVAQGANNGPTPAGARAEAAAVRAQQSADRQDVRANRQDVRQLHSEFESLPAVKTFRNTETAYQDVVALSRNPSGVNDTALTYAVMKMAAGDGSVVRESEFQLLGRAAGIPDQTIAAMTRAANGESLTPRMRQMVVEAAGTLRAARLGEYNQAANRYRAYAQEDGVSPDRIAPLVGDNGRRQRTTNAPGIPFNLAQPQLQARQRLVQGGANARSPVGSPLNPRYVNPSDERGSYANIRPGEWFVAPDGSVLQKPPARTR